MIKWQPMSTAPTGGQPILLLVWKGRKSARTLKPASYIVTEGYATYNGWMDYAGRLLQNTGRAKSVSLVIGWMPLPDLPTEHTL